MSGAMIGWHFNFVVHVTMKLEIYIYINMAVIPHTALLSHSKLAQGKFLPTDKITWGTRHISAIIRAWGGTQTWSLCRLCPAALVECSVRSAAWPDPWHSAQRHEYLQPLSLEKALDTAPLQKHNHTTLTRSTRFNGNKIILEINWYRVFFITDTDHLYMQKHIYFIFISHNTKNFYIRQQQQYKKNQTVYVFRQSESVIIHFKQFNKAISSQETVI